MTDKRTWTMNRGTQVIKDGALYLRCWVCRGNDQQCKACGGAGIKELTHHEYLDGTIEPSLNWIVGQLISEVISLHERIERLEASKPEPDDRPYGDE